MSAEYMEQLFHVTDMEYTNHIYSYEVFDQGLN